MTPARALRVNTFIGILGLIIVTGVLELGARSRAADLRDPPPVEEQFADICEGLFRYQFANNQSAFHLGSGTTALLEVRGQELSPAFLARFDDLPFRIMAAHEEPPPRSILFFVRVTGQPHWRRVQVEAGYDGGYYYGPLNAAGNRYTLVQRGEKWVVVDVHHQWIS